MFHSSPSQEQWEAIIGEPGETDFAVVQINRPGVSFTPPFSRRVLMSTKCPTGCRTCNSIVTVNRIYQTGAFAPIQRDTFRVWSGTCGENLNEPGDVYGELRRRFLYPLTGRLRRELGDKAERQ